MIERHVTYTGSERGRQIIENWEAHLPYFVKVFPTDYKRALGRLSQEDAAVERELAVTD
jgi:glutamate synthase domain-containing protein 3